MITTYAETRKAHASELGIMGYIALMEQTDLSLIQPGAFSKV